MAKNENFYTWLKHERYTVILTLVCAFIPFLEHITLPETREGSVPYLSFIIANAHSIANLLFILLTLFALTGTDFLINKDTDKRQYLYQYVRESFGVNCELYRYGADSLFRRMNIAIKQFYYGWLCVWGIWLVLYINDFVFVLFREHCTVYSEDTLSRLNCFAENMLNLLNSTALFFIFMVITISTVSSGNPNSNRKSMHTGVICLICIFAFAFCIDLFAFTAEDTYYHNIQFIMHIFIGMVATISMVAVVGRLNSSYLNVPQWLMIGLYLYAAVQMLYPLAYNGNIRIPYQECIEKTMYAFSFFGKVCLFLMIRWIAKQKRFLFFLVQKANSMSESSFMLRDFYKIYEGCPDEEREK